MFFTMKNKKKKKIIEKLTANQDPWYLLNFTELLVSDCKSNKADDEYPRENPMQTAPRQAASVVTTKLLVRLVFSTVILNGFVEAKL